MATGSLNEMINIEAQIQGVAIVRNIDGSIKYDKFDDLPSKLQEIILKEKGLKNDDINRSGS